MDSKRFFIIIFDLAEKRRVQAARVGCLCLYIARPWSVRVIIIIIIIGGYSSSLSLYLTMHAHAYNDVCQVT
jgi:hypothetical protein